ncbi:MAG: RNA polymerase sigma factor [Bacteroidales bacterium]|nr:RNA polymerase sigma factor [Bacteroidales bacterium]
MFVITMTEEEKKIVEGCIKGKSDCQKKLYLLYGPMIKGICQRYTRDEESAQDLFHDTFVFILTHFKDFTNISSLPGWLRKIAINKAIDYYRRENHYQVHSIEDMSEEPCASGKTVNETLSMRDIVGFINQLPLKQRTAFNLYVVEGFEQEEIVTMMDESASNVRTLISRAKSTLRNKIGQYMNKEDFIL